MNLSLFLLNLLSLFLLCLLSLFLLSFLIFFSDDWLMTGEYVCLYIINWVKLNCVIIERQHKGMLQRV